MTRSSGIEINKFCVAIDDKRQFSRINLLDQVLTIGYNPSVKPVLLAIIGKPLSGKDTQADLLAATHPEAVKVSTGHILREVREDGEAHRFWPLVGHLIPVMEAGIKLPDPPIIEMIGEVVKEQVAEGRKRIIIAGSPRSMEQLEGFDQMANDAGADLRFVHIEADDAETYKRSACRNEGRVDDDPEIHAVRLEEYRTHVLPMVEELRREGRIADIDGMKPPAEVYRNVDAEVRAYVGDPEISLPSMARR